MIFVDKFTSDYKQQPYLNSFLVAPIIVPIIQSSNSSKEQNFIGNYNNQFVINNFPETGKKNEIVSTSEKEEKIIEGISLEDDTIDKYFAF